ncbi:unnamed protein product [Arabidopsis halleri]
MILGKNRALWPSGKGVTAVTSATKVRGTATGGFT